MSEIVVGSLTAVVPVVAVIDVTAGRAALATRESAGRIPHPEPVAKIFRHGVPVSTDGEDAAGLRMGEYPTEAWCLSGELPGGLGVDRALALEAARFLALPEEGQDRDGHHDLGPDATADPGRSHPFDEQI